MSSVVLKTYGEAFRTLATGANPMLAMAWLQPVIERYEQEGMKDEAEQLRLIQIEKGKNIASDMKHYSVEAKTTKQDYDDLVKKLLVTNDLGATLSNIAHYFVPSVDSAKKTVEELKTVAPLMSMIPITMVDTTGRALAKIGTDDDGSEGRIFQHLAQTIGFYQSFLSYVIEAVVTEFQPTADDILAVLYTRAISATKREANDRVMTMVLEAGKKKALSAPSSAPSERGKTNKKKSAKTLSTFSSTLAGVS